MTTLKTMPTVTAVSTTDWVDGLAGVLQARADRLPDLVAEEEDRDEAEQGEHGPDPHEQDGAVHGRWPDDRAQPAGRTPRGGAEPYGFSAGAGAEP